MRSKYWTENLAGLKEELKKRYTSRSTSLRSTRTGAVTNFHESTSLFSGQVYQRSRPETDSLSLMKDEEPSKNPEVWKIFCVEIKSLSFKSLTLYMEAGEEQKSECI